ncbi:hypothetical protein LOC71_04940 [Rhodopirellula sp. JC740]|uniref:Uncharacterized protein n=1 Tax=Rhodopirellula halodulae TaxID=2894198 RepID=A0ABS8NDH2_9BACT|nr:hypothetical protein [Rhodopirellula sp. JC740]MCC9641610.1 hypothetical protein [Rhodopirellula sp. JC740]
MDSLSALYSAMTDYRIISYAHENFTAEQLPRFAAQYDGVNMAALKGATEDRFPFLVRSDTHPLGYNGCWWNPYCGITIEMNDDAVQDYAFVAYLLENAYPRFDSFDAADDWAAIHNWPLKSLDDLPADGG